MNPPDFRAYVRQRLPSLNTTSSQDSEIVEDLAAQLEDAYARALNAAGDEQQALRQVEAQLRQDSASWQELDGYLRRRVAAPARIGSPERVALASRLERWAYELRHALRPLVRDARVTVPVAITLIACIGVNAAVFTIVNSVLLRPLPFPDSDRVVLLASQTAAEGPTLIRSDVPSYFDRLQRLTVFEQMAMFRWIDVSIDTPNGPQRVRGDIGTTSLLRLIGVAPLHGRLFHEHEGEAGAEQKVILSYGLWQELYGGNPEAIGTEIQLDGRPFTIVGVMPSGFGIFRLDARLWIPAVYGAAEKVDARRGFLNQYQIARLKEGATLDDARRQLAAFDVGETERLPALRAVRQRSGFYTSVDRLQDAMTRDVRPILEFLWVGALLVLLVGIVNTATLTIARVRRNTRELATRLALGARGSHILRRLLAEGLLLGTVSGVGGLLLGAGLLSVLPGVGLAELPRAEGLHLDVTGLFATLAAALTTGLLVGVAPGMWMASADLSRTMRSYTRSRTGDRRARVVRRALVMAQVAVAFVLMTGTSLLVVSFWRLLEQEPGFTMEGVTTASFDVPATRYPAPEDAERFVTRALDAVRRVPGVVSAGVTQLLPFGGRTATFAVRRDDQAGAVSAWNCVVSPGYLDAMQIPLLAGRHFDDRDTSDSPPVVVIDEVLAARLWPNGDALGQELLFPPTVVARPMTVIGIVGTVRQASLAGGRTDARGTTYRVHAQASDRGYTLAIRTAPSASVMPAVVAAVQALDPHLPLYDVKAMADRVYGTLAPRSLALTLGTIFVATGLLLAMMGIYGVLANLVTERRREFAIRLALGSSVPGVVRLVVGEAALLAGAGVMLGLVGGLWLRDLLRSHVYGVDTTDPSVIAASVAVVALVAAMACLAPVRRVAQVAPATVLEQE